MKPLAERIRPKDLEGWIGHSEVMAPGKPLYEAIKSDRLFSFILYAPAGTGKTSLCQIIKTYTKSRFISLSAVHSGVKEIKAAIEEAKAWKDRQSRETILFIDEIHRFNKSQQDSLLQAVELGDLTLIGATTENPSFELNSALLSRLRVFRLEPLQANEILRILERGISQLDQTEVKVVEAKALEKIAELSQGDARTAINALEWALPEVTLKSVEKLFEKKFIFHDKHGDLHHQVVSAFIKSMRAGQTKAALYYLARMWEAGEDPLYIARRMVIFASEDVGNADLRALALANAVRNSVEFVGRPECFYALSQGVIYLSKAAKSREAGDSFQAALDQVRSKGAAPVPGFLTNATTKLDRHLGRGREREDDESFFPEGVSEN